GKIALGESPKTKSNRSQAMLHNSLAYTIRPAASADEPILWDMLFYAANMAEDGATSSEVAKTHPFLAEFVAGWGRPGDLGVIAITSADDQVLGAAWLRQLSGPEKHYAAVAEGVPELAIAV